MDTTDMYHVKIIVKGGVVGVSHLDEGVAVTITDHDNEEVWCHAHNLDGTLTLERGDFPK